MNLGSWIVLAIVVVIIGLAIRATFFPKARKGGCCDVGDSDTKSCCCEADKSARDDERDSGKSCEPGSSACEGCSACCGSATARNAVQPVIRPVR